MDDDASMGGIGGQRGRGGFRGRARGTFRGRGTGGPGQQPHRQSLKLAGPQSRGARGRGRGRVMRNPINRAPNGDGDASMSDSEVIINRRDRNYGSWISVRGYDDGTSMADLIQFLISKSNLSPPPVVLENAMEGRKAYIMFDTSSNAMRIKTLSGIRMGGAKLFIEFANRRSTGSEGKQGWVAILGEFMVAHYNPGHKLINLANMAGQSHNNINFDFNQVGFVRAIFQAIANKFPDVTTVSFAQNKIHTLQGFSHLSKYTTGIVNLSFDSNDISDFNELDNLKDMKLREVVLSNNPIQHNGQAKYQSEIQKRFQGLKYLDGQKVEPLIDFGLPSHLTSGSLPPILGNWYDSIDTQRLAEDFVTKYFHVYDSGNREGLLDIYTDASLLSISANLFVKKEHRTQRMNQDQGAGAYKAQSRNLMFLKDPAKRVSTLQRGRINIIHLLNTLPQSKHKEWRVDAFIMKQLGPSPLCCINVHGSFTEPANQIDRSFDRTFLLTPAPSNSVAASQGFPALILNDQIHIRHFSTELPKPTQPQPQQPTVGVTPLSSPVTIAPITSPPMLAQPLQLFPQPEIGKQQILEKLRYVTKMKPEFALQALEQNNWVYEKALEAFYVLQRSNQIAPNMLEQ